MTHSFFAPYDNFLHETLNGASGSTHSQKILLNKKSLTIQRLGLGVISIRPETKTDTSTSTRSSGPDSYFIVSSAIHGNETAPVEICNELITAVLEGDIDLVKPVLFIFGNPKAMNEGRRFIDENLNRLFLGKHSASDKEANYETHRAKALERYVDQFLATNLKTTNPRPVLHFDLHTAIRGSLIEKFALYPFVPERTPRSQHLTLLSSAEVQALLLQSTPSGTFSSFTATRYDAESYTVELGSVKPFGQNDLTRYQAIKETLISVLEGKETQLAKKSELEVFEVCHEILNTHTSFELLISDEVLNFTPFAPGTLIWQDIKSSYHVGMTTEYLVFPNAHVPVGQRAGLMLRKRRPK
jgi:succinylglutamate desuccinylase